MGPDSSYAFFGRFAPYLLRLWLRFATNQLLGRAPLHALYEIKVNDKPPCPSGTGRTRSPNTDGPIGERLNHWLTLVQRGDVLGSYRVFLGLMNDAPNRRQVLAQLAFAGLIDAGPHALQPLLHHRPQVVPRPRHHGGGRGGRLGERPRRAVRGRARHRGGAALVLDLRDGLPGGPEPPREPRSRPARAGKGPLTAAEAALLVQRDPEPGQEPAFIEVLVALLRVGRAPRRIIDTIQIAAAQVIIDTGDLNNYSMPQHSYEYCNTVGWFYDTFEHPHRLSSSSWRPRSSTTGPTIRADTPDNGRRAMIVPPGRHHFRRASSWSVPARCSTGAARLRGGGPERGVPDGGFERAPLVQTTRDGRVQDRGNDPHNQELGSACWRTTCTRRPPAAIGFLLASAKHTAGHKKCCGPAESYRRFRRGPRPRGLLTGAPRPMHFGIFLEERRRGVSETATYQRDCWRWRMRPRPGAWTAWVARRGPLPTGRDRCSRRR